MRVAFETFPGSLRMAGSLPDREHLLAHNRIVHNITFMTTPVLLEKTLYTAHASATGGRDGLCPYSNATRGNITVDVKVA